MAPSRWRRHAGRRGLVVVLVLTVVGVVALLRPWQQPLSGAALRAALDGTWTGRYTCSQGVTGLTIDLRTTGPSTLEGEFHFYAVASNPRVPSGSSLMTGTFTSRTLRLQNTRWLSRPGPNWMLVNLSADLPRGSFTDIAGDIDAAGCASWQVTKQP